MYEFIYSCMYACMSYVCSPHTQIHYPGQWLSSEDGRSGASGSSGSSGSGDASASVSASDSGSGSK